jgi:hypothetical protein
VAQFQPKYPRTPREPPIIAGKVPPHDLEAEAAVLSAILLKQETLDQVAELLKPEHFYSEANGKIYEAAEELARQSQPIDTVRSRPGCGTASASRRSAARPTSRRSSTRPPRSPTSRPTRGPSARSGACAA